MYRIFGREPAAWVALVEAAIALGVCFGLLGLTGDQVGLVMAFVSAAGGAFIAWRTREISLGIILGLVRAVIALTAGFGLPLTAGQTTAVIVFVTVVTGLFNRTQTSPLP